MKKAVVVGAVLVATIAGSSIAMANNGLPQSWDEATALLGKHEQHQNFSIDPKTAAFHVHTLKNLGVNTNASALKNGMTFTDNNGNSWVYTSYIQEHLISDQIRSDYGVKAANSFIEMEGQILQAQRRKGDTVPAILMNQELTKGVFAFSREEGKGEVVAVHFAYNSETGEFEETK